MRPIRMILPPVLAGLALPLAADPGPLEFFSNSPAGYSSQTSNEAFPVGNGKLAAMIYGDAMDRLWGPMEPVPEDRLVPLEDDATLEVGGARYRVLHTPGHAKHHLALIDPDGGAFVGDAAGILLPGVPLIRPALPPPETDLEAAAASCERLAGENLARLWLTHFGVVDDVAAHLDAVVRRNAEWGAEVKAGMDAAREAPPAFAVLDLRLGDGSGLDIVSVIQERRPDSRIVMLTGYGNIATAVAAVKAAA